MKKSLIVMLALALVVATAGIASAAQLFISDNNVATATIGVYEVFNVAWSNSAAQGSFGTQDISSGDVYAFSDQHLVLTAVSNNYSDFRAVMYLRNWDDSGDANDANPLCALDATDPDVKKGLVAVGTTTVDAGSQVLLMKWGREVIGTTNQITIPHATANLTTWQDGPGDGNWKWFLDETCDADAAFRLDTSQYGTLNYATITTKAELNWAGSTTSDIYMMAWFDQALPAGEYKTNTITVEIMSE